MDFFYWIHNFSSFLTILVPMPMLLLIFSVHHSLVKKFNFPFFPGMGGLKSIMLLYIFSFYNVIIVLRSVVIRSVKNMSAALSLFHVSLRDKEEKI